MTKRQEAYLAHILMRDRGHLIIRGLSEVEINTCLSKIEADYRANPPKVPTSFKITIKQKG